MFSSFFLVVYSSSSPPPPVSGRACLIRFGLVYFFVIPGERERESGRNKRERKGGRGSSKCGTASATHLRALRERGSSSMMGPAAKRDGEGTACWLVTECCEAGFASRARLRFPAIYSGFSAASGSCQAKGGGILMVGFYFGGLVAQHQG